MSQRLWSRFLKCDTLPSSALCPAAWYFIQEKRSVTGWRDKRQRLVFSQSLSSSQSSPPSSSPPSVFRSLTKPMPTASATCSAKKASGPTTPPTAAWRWFCPTRRVKATITVSRRPLSVVTKHWASVQAEVRDQTIGATRVYKGEGVKNFPSAVEALFSKTGMMPHLKSRYSRQNRVSELLDPFVFVFFFWKLHGQNS